MTNYTYNQIAHSYDLFTEYVDPAGTLTREQFDGMTIDQAIAAIIDVNGVEKLAIRAWLVGGDAHRDVVEASWNGRGWSGDGAFTGSTTDQQIIDEQWAWQRLADALDDGETSGEFEIADSGTWRWERIDE